MSTYYTHAQLESAIDKCPHFPAWIKKSFHDFTHKAGSKDFPCYFAPSSIKQQKPVYIAVDDVSTPDNKQAILRGVHDYLGHLATLTDAEAAKIVLVLLVKPDAHCKTHDDYQKQFFTLLDDLLSLDTSPWPDNVPENPDHPDWKYSLFQTPLFLFANVPSHQQKQSRHLGDGMVIIMAPSSAFGVVFNHDAGQEAKIRGTIRDRVASYDGQPASADLLSANDNGQYFIPDDNALPACPFLSRQAQKSIKQPDGALENQTRPQIVKCPMPVHN